jgi:TPR repeat protein
MTLEKETKKFNEIVEDYLKKVKEGERDPVDNFTDHYKIPKKFNKLQKYYLSEIEKGNRDAMFNLGLYHEKINEDEKEMVKYFLMFIGGETEDVEKYIQLKDQGEKEEYCLIALERTPVGMYFKLGKFFEKEENYDKMKKYYESSAQYGNYMAMTNLGHYYHFKEKNGDETKKWYQMAINYGSDKALFNMGSYYETEEKDEDKMKMYYFTFLGGEKIYNQEYFEKIMTSNTIEKYALLAIERTDIGVMFALGNSYYEKKDYETMKGFFEMAIKFRNIYAMRNMATYYRTIEKNEEEMRKYCGLAIENGDTEVEIFLANYEIEQLIEKIKNEEYINFVNEERECLICLEKKNQGMIDFHCKENVNHSYCAECFVEWYSANDAVCVYCKKILEL